MKKFSFHANVEDDITRGEDGQYKNETSNQGDFWILTFKMINLSKDKTIKYWYSVIANRLAYVSDGGWTIEGTYI